jgi:hypothetical protein
MIRTPSGTLTERYDHGIRLRRRTPHEHHADLLGPADRDPVAILAAGDRTRVPELIPVADAGKPIRFLARCCSRDGGGPEASTNSGGCRAGLRRLPSDELWSVRHARGERSF